MEKWKKRTVELVAGLSLSDKKYPSVTPYQPKKPHICPREALYFSRVSPDRQGISTATLRCMLSELEAETRANIHSLLVLSNGGVICRCAAPGYDGAIPHLAHSMSKTVTGMAIGFLVAEGHLSVDTTIARILPEYPVTDKRLRTATVRHLLSMQSGVKFNEAGVVTDAKWTETFFASSLSAAPGTVFNYNSMNSYILARIVHRVTGEGLVDYLMPRLFEPLHIERPLWQLGPEGVECGGWGLFLTDDSWGKLALMLMQNGMFEGKQILPETYIREMLSTQAKTPVSLGDFNYGFHIWVGRETKEFLFNGMLGQNVWCDPTRGLIAVISAGNNEIFAQSPALSIIRRRLCFPLPAEEHRFLLHRREYANQQAAFFCRRHWIRASAPAGGFLNFLRHRGTSYDTRWDGLLGSYIFRQNNNGILPLFVRVMENCYTGGIDSLTLRRRGERLWMTVVEGGTPLSMEIGLKDFAETVLTFREETYLVRTMGEVVADEDGRPVYKIELCFPELPNVRRIKIFETPNGCYKMRMEELPNQNLGKAFIDSFPAKNALLNEILERRLGDGYLHRLLKDMFSPTLLAIPAEKENALLLLEEEEKKRAARRRSVSFITGIVQRFFVEPEERGQPAKRGLISELFSKITAPKKRSAKDERSKAATPAKPPILTQETPVPLSPAAEAEVETILALMENADTQEGEYNASAREKAEADSISTASASDAKAEPSAEELQEAEAIAEAIEAIDLESTAEALAAPPEEDEDDML